MNFVRHIHRAILTQPGLRARALRGASLALLVLLTACGFQMRGVTPLPFDTLYVGIPETTRFGAEVRRAIRAASPDTKLVDTIKGAEAQLQQVASNRTMREVSLNAQGRVEEYELGIQFTFRVIDSTGRALLPDTTLETYREMPYDDQVVQAKEGQAESLYRSMQTSLVSRLVRRMTAADVRIATEKARNEKPGDETGPIYDINPPKQARPQPWNNTPGITNGPQMLDRDY
jgi:LPS-assembly lipoprotein